MRVAVLLTGQPRHLEHGAWWFKNRVFPNNDKFTVDYYCCFWNDHTPDLQSRINNAYNPIRVSLIDYDNYINKFVSQVKEANEHCNLKHLLPDTVRFNILMEPRIEYLSKFAYNFWGQYLISGIMSKMTGDLSNDYDIVIKTRSDIAFNPISIDNWMALFQNMLRNPNFDTKIFSDWLYIKNGIPYLSDFAFFAKPKNWHNYTKNMYENCFNLATRDKLLWYNCHFDDDVKFPHKTWNNLSLYSKTDWLSFHVVWPTPYTSTLIRNNDYDITKETFQSLLNKFNLTK